MWVARRVCAATYRLSGSEQPLESLMTPQVLPLIEALAEAADVRPHLADIFDVPGWLAARRRPDPAPRRHRSSIMR